MSEGLQRYQIMETLGAGSQGHTYRAIDRNNGEAVAVKVLSLGGAHDWKAFELFEREAKVLADLQHPGIPRYRDYFASEDSGDYFLVMDLVEGRSLAEHLAKPEPGRPPARHSKALDEAALRRILLGVLDILEYLHGRSPPVIHRDIKPANVIVDARGLVHLVDFGGVRVAGSGGSTMVGTFGYMAPEQLHGEAGPATDLYALGATIVALAAGRNADELPHDGLAIDLDAIELPAGLKPVLRSLLEPDPRQRISSAAAVRERLERRATPRDEPRPDAGESSTALAIPGIVHGLAQTPKPLSILVWLASLMGAAALTMMEFVFLPIVYLILRAVADKEAKRGRTIDDDEAGITSLRAFRKNATRQRQLVMHVVRSTSPLRDDQPALPPGPRDR